MLGRDFGGYVFIRSIASVEVGGLARAASVYERLFNVCGWPLVIIEPLGIGQVELDIMALADAVAVVLNTGWGDTFQANKAGGTEVGDLFVIDKADRPGVVQTRKDLQDSLALLQTEHPPAIVETVAAEGTRIETLWAELEGYRLRLLRGGELAERRAERRQRLLHKRLCRAMEERLEKLLASGQVDHVLKQVGDGLIDVD